LSTPQIIVFALQLLYISTRWI